MDIITTIELNIFCVEIKLWGCVLFPLLTTGIYCTLLLSYDPNLNNSFLAMEDNDFGFFFAENS